MDSASPQPKLSGPRLRYHRRTPIAPSIDRQELESKEEEEEAQLRPSTDAPLLIRAQTRGTVMGKDHRQFHRRVARAATTKVLTVDVEIIVTVDSAGSLLAKETVTQTTPSLATASASASVSASASTAAAASASATASLSLGPIESLVPSTVPSVAAAAAAVSPGIEDVPFVLADLVSTALSSIPSVPAYALNIFPSVPSVPPFPSDLTVPAYPYPSGVPVQEANVDTSPDISSSSSTATTPSLVAAPIPIPSTSTSIITSSSTSTLSSTSTSLSPPQSVFKDSQNSSTSSSSSSSQTEPTPSTSDSIIASFVTSSQATATAYHGGEDGPANVGGSSADATAVSPADATASVTPADTGNSSPLVTKKVVGSVLGSLAGAALILMVLLFLIKRYKRSKRSPGLVLTNDANTDNSQSMRQAPTSNNLVPAAFLHRFSSMSRSTVGTNATGERSFQRVSGRKLPSAFSGGMSSGQFVREGGSISGTSLYPDDQSIYGGAGLSKEFGSRPSKEYGPEDPNEFDKEIGGSAAARVSSKMNIRPSPARTPVIHHANDENPFEDYNYRSTLSPPMSPNSDFPKRNTLGRSLASADGSRSSRFTENV